MTVRPNLSSYGNYIFIVTLLVTCFVVFLVSFKVYAVQYTSRNECNASNAPGNTLWGTFCPFPLKASGDKEAIHYQAIKPQSNLLGRNPWPSFVQFRCHHSTTTFSYESMDFCMLNTNFHVVTPKKPTVFCSLRSKIDVFHKETS